jgi:hypothetical protein
MYTVARAAYGVRVSFSGQVSAEEARQWSAESRLLLDSIEGRFHVLIDMRAIAPPSAEALAEIAAGQSMYEAAGMDRSAVIVGHRDLAERFTAAAQASGDDEWERYIDASSSPDWEARAVTWLEAGIDPYDTDVSA